MIKLLNKYSGVVQVVMIIIGICLGFQLFSNKLDDIGSDVICVKTEFQKYKDFSIQEREQSKISRNRIMGEVIGTQNKIIFAIENQAIHQGYMIEAIKSQTQTNVQIYESIIILNGLLSSAKRSTKFEIARSKNGNKKG